MPAKQLSVVACLIAGSLIAIPPSEAQQIGRPGGPFGTHVLSYFHPDVPELPRLLAALAMHPKVKEELKLNAEQVASLTVYLDAPRVEPPQRSTENLNSLSTEDRAKALQKIVAERDLRAKDLRKRVEAVEAVLTPAQNARFKQIVTQMRGIEVLDDLEVIENLDISEGQIRQFAKLGDEFRAAYFPVAFPSDSTGRVKPEHREKMQELKDGLRDKIVALLTPGQRAKYDAMKGEIIEIDAGRLVTSAMMRRPPRPMPKD